MYTLMVNKLHDLRLETKFPGSKEYILGSWWGSKHYDSMCWYDVMLENMWILLGDIIKKTESITQMWKCNTAKELKYKMQKNQVWKHIFILTKHPMI